MKAARIVGIILVVFGALVVVGSVLGDLLLGGSPGFGVRQIGGAVVGAVDVVLGLILLLARKSG